jgi:hypothetical protein
MSLFLALALVATPPAAAEINPEVRVNITQNYQIVGAIFADRAPGACRALEYWYLYDTYVYPNARAGGFEVHADAPATARGTSAERFIAEMYASHPGGTLVTVDIREFSADCH